MTRTFAAAAALALSAAAPLPAHAARIATSPLYVIDATAFTCSLQWLGQRTTPVAIVGRQGPTTKINTATIVTAAGTSYDSSAECDGGSCDNVICVFRFPGDRDDLRGSACARGPQGTVCQGAR